MKYILVLIIPILIFAKCKTGDKELVENITKFANELKLNVINEFPHDNTAFTEGLQYFDGKLYEGTGLEKQTKLKIIDIKTGKASFEKLENDPKIFGEGITILNGKLYQLTYQNKKVFEYNLTDLNTPNKIHFWPYQGWGMTNDGSNIYVSDGSAFIYTVSPQDFKIIDSVPIKMNGNFINNINELEYIEGFIYANIWTKDIIVKIDLKQKEVVSFYDAKFLVDKTFPNGLPTNVDIVLNGIAYDSTKKHIFITGKNWPRMYECSF